MQNDRRRILVAGATGAATLLLPGVSQACLLCRCRHARGGKRNNRPCPSGFTWSSTTPYIPDALNITAEPNAHQFTVYGTGLQNVSKFLVTVSDDVYGSSIQWYMDGNYTPTINQDGTALTFYEDENGSTAGTSSTITITITLSGYGGCFQSWSGVPVKYA